MATLFADCVKNTAVLQPVDVSPFCGESEAVIGREAVMLEPAMTLLLESTALAPPPVAAYPEGHAASTEKEALPPTVPRLECWV